MTRELEVHHFINSSSTSFEIRRNSKAGRTIDISEK